MGVIVLGMHRSGTSAVTAALHHLGLDVPHGDDLLVGAPDNPEGHWESRSLIRFNNALLAALGGAWISPPTVGEGWERHPRLERELARAGDVFSAAFPTERWVWKDPRNCFLAPFWYRVLGDRHPIVLVFRHPLEVAESIQQRNRIDKRRALVLWEQYTDSALRHAAGRPTLVTSYERALEATDEWTRVVIDFLARHGLAPAGQSAAETEPLLRPQLRHVVHHPGDLASDPDVTERQRQLFDVLRALEGVQDRLSLPSQ